MMLPKILWICDQCKPLASLIGPVNASGRYGLVTADDAEQALNQILTREFNVIIIEPANLLPGKHPLFRRLYFDQTSEFRQYLGWALLYLLLKPEKVGHRLAQLTPGWFTTQRLGIMTVELPSNVKTHLQALGITVHQEAGVGLPHTALLSMADAIMRQQGKLHTT